MTDSNALDLADIAAKLAEALRLAREWFRHEEASEGPQAFEVIGAADEALAQYEQAKDAEPVAWRILIGDSDLWGYADSEWDADFYGRQSGLRYVKQALYAAPVAQAKPLTDEQIDALDLAGRGVMSVRDMVRLVERAHGIGGEWKA